MDSLNLINDINITQGSSLPEINMSDETLDTSIFINDSDTSYTRYLELIDTYFKESIKSKFTSNFKYLLDDDGNYAKQAYDEKDSNNNLVILKPKYININDRLNELDLLILNYETKLRIYRTQMLDGKLSVKEEFNALYKLYEVLIKEKNSINHHNTKINKSHNENAKYRH